MVLKTFVLLILVASTGFTQGLASKETPSLESGIAKERVELSQEDQDVFVIYGSSPPLPNSSSSKDHPVIPTFTVGPNVKSQIFDVQENSDSLETVVLQNEEDSSFGIEQLFRDFERPSSEAIETQPLIESSFGSSSNTVIRPSSVERTQELPAVSIKPKQKKAESVVIVVPTSISSDHVVTRVQSSTILSNFYDGDSSVGLVTSKGGTLIANGVTTVNAIRVYGTYLPDGQYAQVVQSSAKVFDEDISPTPGFSGTVQYVSEKPTFGVEVSGVNQQRPKKRENSNVAGVFSNDEYDDDEDRSTTGSRLQQTPSQKEAAQQQLRNRLKNRFQKFKAKLNAHDQAQPRSGVVGRGSVSALSPSSFRSGRRTGFSRQQSQEVDRVADEEEVEADDLPEVDRSSSQRGLSSFNSNRRNFREQPQRRFNNRQRATTQKSTQSRQNSFDLSGQASIQRETVYTDFGTKKRNNFRDRPSGFNRFRVANAQKASSSQEQDSSSAGLKFPSLSLKSNRPKFEVTEKPKSKPAVTFKPFNRFSRPDIRKSLLEKILSKGKGENTIDPDELEKEEQDEEVDDLQSNDISSVDGLQTTLDVSTVFPSSSSSVFFEVATIRSPYSFDFEEGMSTRFITVTRTFTSSVTESSSPVVITPSEVVSSMPLFKTETIPAPENILASTATVFDDSSVLELSSSIETLPAVVLASSTSVVTPPLKTVTETFSTRELTLKTSILPLVVNGKTSLHTLTQSFYVTKLIEAVKTVPAAENYEFVATQAFKDLSNVLEEAGSEKREQLLPGELEFSDQDEFGLDGPTEIRVPPPEGFADDLKIFESVNQQEQDPTFIQPSIEPSKPSLEAGSEPSVTTPSLPQFNPLAAFTPEQIQQLAFLQYLQNFGGLNGLQNLPNPFGQPQEVVTSSPVYRTETLFATSTIPLFLGAKKFFTTLTQSIGMTTITDYETVTMNNNGAGLFGQLPAVAPTAAAVQPAFEETTKEIIKDTVIPSTITKEIKITFRNKPTTTTLTSTTMVTTQITSYVTKTVRSQSATTNPFNPFAAFG